LAAVDAQTEAGAVMAADGAPVIGSVAVELLLQPADDVTVIASVTLPLAPGVKVIAFVPLPLVMLPLRIDQL